MDAADQEETLWYAWIHKRGEITHRYQPRLFLLVQEPDSLVEGESDTEDAPPVVKLYYFKGDMRATPSVPTKANCRVAGLKYCADCDMSRATVFTGAEENTLRIVTWDKTWQLRCDHKRVSALYPELIPCSRARTHASLLPRNPPRAPWLVLTTLRPAPRRFSTSCLPSFR